MKEISAWVWNPANSIFKENKNEKALGYVFLCDSHESCELYAKGQCLLPDIKCPYGRKTKEVGYSRRAQGFGSWISTFKKNHKEVINKSLSMPKKMVYVGDYVYLPISFLDLHRTYDTIEWGGMLSADKYVIKKEMFTAEFIANNIIKVIPRAWLGGTIRDYQEREVPKFITWLKELDKPLFEEVKKLCPDDKRFEFISNVGRKAKIHTLTPNVGIYTDIHGGEWTWDGEYITSYNCHASFCLVETRNIEECKIRPTKDAVAKVTDDDQVNENTEFID